MSLTKIQIRDKLLHYKSKLIRESIKRDNSGNSCGGLITAEVEQIEKNSVLK